MANRFPLIVNTTSGNSVQELPSGDFLDLSNSGISNSGNIAVRGIVSATGNITGNYILGNGSQLSGIITSVANISSGTSNVTVVSSGGNVTVGVGGTGNVVQFATTGVYVTGIVSATGAVTGAGITGSSLTVSTGNVTAGNLVLSGAIIDSAQLDIQTSAANANIVLTPNGTGNVNTGANLSVTGNVQGGNLRTAGLISATGSITVGGDISLTGNIVDAAAMTISTSSNGNITLSPNGTGVVVVNKDIQNGQGNGVGNIGSATTYFNTVFAKATSAQYADLAENYEADAEYEPGTVVVFGGTNEITISDKNHDTAVA